LGIPYYEIPIRTSKKRLGKFALMGFLERLGEEMKTQIDEVSGKGKEVYESDL
jgi:hypothetical protein